MSRSPPNHMPKVRSGDAAVNGLHPQDPPSKTRLRNKFATVTPARPTPAKKHVPSFVEGHFQKQKSSKLKSFVKKAMDVYNYDNCPLPENHIRLMFLKPSKSPGEPIVVELQAVPIDDLINDPDNYPFTALSYSWGGGADNEIVYVDIDTGTELPTNPTMPDVTTEIQRRRRTLHVKPNLFAFLQQFRDKEIEVALWVDRVCINQASNQEKQDQVSRMGTIYSTAANVAIWLGPSDQHGASDRAMGFIPCLLEDTEQKLHSDYAEDWSQLLLLMRRQWFSRRWIIQELALSKNAEVRCGSRRVHWKDFSDAVSIFALHFDQILNIIKQRPDLDESHKGIKDLKPFGARILVDVLSNMFQRNPDRTIYTPRQGLESLVSSLSTFETSDPRDTVYTLLNLAKETHNLPSRVTIENKHRTKKNETNPPPEPDYKLDLLEVYVYFIKWCVTESKSLDILCRHWALPEVKQKIDDFYPRIVTLPSWITTVVESAYGSQKEGFGGRRTGDSFVGLPETRWYNASSGIEPTITFGRDQGTAPRRSPHPSTPNGMITQSSGLASHPLLPRTTITRVPRAQQDLGRLLTVRGYFMSQVQERHQMLEGIIPRAVLQTLGHDSDAPELDHVPDAIWRTLVADRDPDGRSPPAWYHRACMTCLVSDTTAGNIDTNAILQKKIITTLQSSYLKRVQAVCWNRTFIECRDPETGNKLVGIGPLDSKQEDLVCILYGCSVPCVLRPVLYGSGLACYQLIGEAFILGRMDGEAVRDFTEEDLKQKSEHFTLI
ncbi:Heterokaryon incompatibility protein [Paramyrothecium foliicola]|nr:Heterokaryon incompatibility protein [Paramyrothecium foliicola]